MAHRPLVFSFRDACCGIGFVLRTQRNARIQLIASIAVAALAAALQIPLRDCAVLAVTVAMVFAAEVANTVLETLVDAILPKPNEAARITKDAAAATVLVLAIASAVVGLCIFAPPLWKLFG